MKHQRLLALTFLLSQTVSAGAMELNEVQYDPTKKTSSLVSIDIDKSQALPPMGALQLNPADAPDTVYETVKHAKEMDSLSEIQSVGTHEIKVNSKFFLSSKKIQKVLSHLESFGLSPQDAEKRWETFNDLMTQKGKFPLKLANAEPYFIASSLWRAHQEMAVQNKEGANTLSYPSLLSLLLSSELRLNKKSFLSQDLQLLKSLAQSNPYFKILDLFQCGIEDPHVAFLITIPHLKALSLEGNKITDLALSYVIEHSALEKLDLSNNAITSEGAKTLSRSKNIKDLDLHNNLIGDEGALYLSKNSGVKGLNLRRTGIGNEGAKALSKNDTLITLILSDNKINDNGAETFLTNKSLKGLELKHNQISKDLLYHVEHFIRGREDYLKQLLDANSPLPPHLLPTQKERVMILSIDGGGIRGAMPAYILHHIAEEIALKTGEPFYFAKHTDLLAGTSTGGLISLGCAIPGEKGLPKYTTKTLVELYTKHGRDIFPAPWSCLKGIFEAKYSPASLEKTLKHYFEEMTLSSSLSHTLITSFDLGNNTPRVFDSYNAKKSRSEDFKMADVARSTSAAPTYFPAAKVENELKEKFEFVDGGIYANTPSLLALKRAQQLYPNAKEYMLFSLGTGCGPKKNLSDLGNAGMIGWAINITNVLMGNAAMYTENLLQAECERDSRIKYIRIQPSIPDSAQDMDNVKAENIDELIKAAQQTIEKEKKNINFIINEFYKKYEKK